MDLASVDPLSQEVMDSIANFRREAIAWGNVSERAFAAARDLPFDWVTL